MNIRSALTVYVAAECGRPVCGVTFGPVREPPDVETFLNRARSRGWRITEDGKVACPEHRAAEEAFSRGQK